MTAGTPNKSYCGLTTLKQYKFPDSECSLFISSGSVTHYASPDPSKGAIVNAANQGCLGGGGVDGAINMAGGDNLMRDRKALPIVGDKVQFIRCRTGDAKITGPGEYGTLKTKFVIHAVGPNSNYFVGDAQRGDDLLRTAYESSLIRAKEAKLDYVAFALLSAGVYRGAKKLSEVLEIGVRTICDNLAESGVKEVHMCAFSEREGKVLVEKADAITQERFL
eukprot:CAMPEP_0196822032 /NCGR_PEP_ID=MMETSP1362-20130617/81898_1 /TAXON_ID=163516 /ORGANISM="Leptocylindrus danicus, Strain CCMP1856" /LENGTH=220 /DNA_ID=CAMNT_0042201455 /DNA_START=37 /DNA_END=699 /DNA_ORIENTATION=-